MTMSVENPSYLLNEWEVLNIINSEGTGVSNLLQGQGAGTHYADCICVFM